MSYHKRLLEPKEPEISTDPPVSPSLNLGYNINMSEERQVREKKLKKARWYNDRNRIYKACLIYLDLLRQDPNNQAALEDLAQIYMDRGDSLLAAICYGWLLSQEPSRQDLVLKEAQCHFQAGYNFLSLKALSRVSDWDSNYEEEALMAKSQIHVALGNELESIHLLNQLIEKYPNALYYMILAELLEQHELYHCAMEACRRGLKREPYQDELLSLKARLHLYLGEYANSRKIYLKMIKNHMYLEDARLDLEDFLAEKGNVPDVMALLRFFDEMPQED